MKAIFERKLNFERKELISRIQMMQDRPDIQKILKMEPNNLPDRLVFYLKKLDLLDNYDQLTELGERALEEGQILSEEYGQYEIWYLKDDPWFKTLPVALHRIRAGGNSQRDKQKRDSEWKNSGNQSIWTMEDHDVVFPLLDSDTGNRTWLRSLSVEAIRSTRTEQEHGLLHCETDDVDAPIVKCDISGNMRWSQREKKYEKLNLERYFNESAKDLISDILVSEFDRKRNVLIVKRVPDGTEELTSFVKRQFEKHGVISEKYGTFSRIVIEDIPMRAANQYVAKEWILRLMQHTWASRHVSREQAEQDQKDWLQSQALGDMDLSSSSGEELLSVLGRESGPAYWNVAVMQDLIPSGIKTKVSFTLSKGECNVDQKIRRHLFEGRSIQKIIISDGYVTPESLPVLKQMLPNSIIVQIHSFKYKLEDALPYNWTHKNLPKGDNHDRIWLIKSGNQWEYWNFSTSADHFVENDGGVVVNKQMTVTPIVKLPKYLQDIVDEQMNGGML